MKYRFLNLQVVFRSLLERSISGALLVLVGNLLFFTQCLTQPAPPGGGPKDTIPPILVATSIPANGTDISDRKIIFYFNENVNLNNQQAITVNPNEPDNKPMLYAETNRVIVRWKRPLSPATTYSIYFGDKTITDLNEANTYPEPIYFVFSTGKEIDNVTIYGAVLDASTGKADPSMLATLFSELEDSAVVLKHPRYTASLDSVGRYVFWNVKSGKYKLYAVKDASRLGKYLSTSQLFAFYDKTVSTENPTVKIPLLYAFSVPKKEPNLKELFNKDNSATTFVVKKTPDTLLYTSNVKSSMYIHDTLIFSFKQPIEKIDSTKIHIYRDSIVQKHIPIKTFLTADSSSYQVICDLAFKPKKETFLIAIDSTFAQDVFGNYLLHPDTLRFSTVDEKQYGRLEIQHALKNSEDNHYILHIQQNGKTIFSLPLSSSTLEIPYIPVGKYDAQLLNDKNKNGVWDYGMFLGGEKRQPEIVTALSKAIEIVAKETTSYVIELDDVSY